MRVAIVVVLLLGAVLAAAPAMAQREPDGLRLALEPPEVKVAPGEAAGTRLVLANRLQHEVVLRLRAEAPPDVRVQLEREEVTLAPGAVERVPARLRVASQAAPGELAVVFEAVDTRPMTADRPIPRAAAKLLVAVVAPAEPAPGGPDAPPEPGPIVSPAVLAVEARPGETRTREIVVENPHAAPLSWPVHLRLPPGWQGRAEPAQVELAPASSRVVLLHLTAPAGPPGEAQGSAEVGAGASAARVALRLRVGPAPGLVALVEPAELVAEPGRSAAGVLVLRNLGDAPLLARPSLGLPLEFQGSIDPGPHSVPAGQLLRVPFEVLVPEDAREGAVHRGAVAVPGTSGAPFRLRVAAAMPAAPPVAEPAQPDAPALVEMHAPEAERAGIALAAASVGGGLAAAGWARRRWPWALALLYTRLRPHRLVEHPTRGAICALLAREPGLTHGEIQRRLGLATGVLTHHLRMLERGRILFSSPHGQQRRYFPVGAARVQPVPPLAERAFAAVTQEGPLSLSALARRLGVSRQALHYHVKRLVAGGRLDARVEGREVLLSAPPAQPPVRR